MPRIVGMLIASAIMARPAVAQAPADEATVKAAFIYNFLKFVEWPAGAFAGPQDSLVVGIIGNSATAVAAGAFLQGRQVNQRTVVVRRLKLDSLMSGVHALFIGDIEEEGVEHLLAIAATGPVLSIGEGARFATQGGIIGLLVESQKVRFVINTDAADLARLRISSKLLGLARVVTSGRPRGVR